MVNPSFLPHLGWKSAIMNLITVVIPTYNASLLIKRAVESVLNQQGAYEVELLVVDDCWRSTCAAGKAHRHLASGANALTVPHPS